MKTAEKNASSVQGTVAKTGDAANRIPNRPSLTGKEAKEDGPIIGGVPQISTEPIQE